MPPPLFSAGFLLPLGLWSVVLPLVAGALAIYMLLPRPQAFPAVRGALLGLLALVLAGFLLVRVAHFNPETFLFYAFSALAIAAGSLLVTQHNPARAALSFAVVVLSTCGLFLLLAAPFLMAATIVIYAGAIVVTFLFVLMLAQQEGLSDADARSREPLLATITGFVLLGALLYVLQLSYGTQQIDQLLERTRQAQAQSNADSIRALAGPGNSGDDLFREYKAYLKEHGQEDLRNRVEGEIQKNGTFDFQNASVTEMKDALSRLETVGNEARERMIRQPSWLSPSGASPLSGLSGPPANTPHEELRRDPDTGLPPLPADNSAYLGRSLFTDYLLPVELGGTLLLVATIGAIAIAHRRTNLERPIFPLTGNGGGTGGPLEESRLP